MERHDYHAEIKADIIAYIGAEYGTEELKEHINNRDELYEKLFDDLWLTDSVTGNASGSYTLNRWEAEENICHNLDSLKDALDEFGSTLTDALEKGAEYCDVTIRCYLLGSVLYQVLDELERGLAE